MRKLCTGDGGVTMSLLVDGNSDRQSLLGSGFFRIDLPAQATGILWYSPMLRAVLLGLVAPVLVLSLATQVPLGLTGSNYRQDEHNEDWNLDALPNPNATDHLVFETVYSLLQHWPNTRMRNGK